MKKICYLTGLLFFVFISVNSLFAADIKGAYQTYTKKLRTCSPYTYNVDGERTIIRIVGRYNRRCIVRTYTYDSKVECTYKTEDLKNYIKALPPSNVYVNSLTKTPGELDTKSIEILEKYSETNKQFIDDGICKSNAPENEKH